MDPNQSLDALVKQLNRKPKGSGQGRVAVADGQGKANARRPGSAPGTRASSAKLAAKSRPASQRPQQSQNAGGRLFKQPVVRLNRRHPSAGILSRLGANAPLQSASAAQGQARPKGRPQAAKKNAAPLTSKTQIAKHVEQVVQQRRLKELSNPRVKLQRKRLGQQGQSLQSRTGQLHSASAQLRRSGPPRGAPANLGQLTVKIKNSKSKLQLAARRSLAKARSSTPGSGSSGILSSEPLRLDVDPPSRPLTIQVDNELSAQQPTAVFGSRAQPSAYVDVDLFRDAQSIAILQTSVRQNIITPAPIQGMGVDVSRPAVGSLPASTGSLHARFTELPHPSQAAAIKPRPAGTATSTGRGRTILG